MQLGVGRSDHRPVPVRVNSFGSAPVLAVAAGKWHTAALTDDGRVWTWGRALGVLDCRQDHSTPQRVNSPHLSCERTIAVVCGSAHTAALTESGVLFMWGLNSNGQLGNNKTEMHAVPMPLPSHVFADQPISQVALGGSHTAAITNQGTLYMWGMAEHGQLGFQSSEDILVPKELDKGRLPETVASVACGNMHTAVITTQGHVWTFGYGGMGQLGKNERHVRMAPTLIDPVHFNGAQAVMVACGSSHTCAVCANGLLYSFGWNLQGQLGLGDYEDRLIPTIVQSLKNRLVVSAAAGHSHTCVVTDDGRLFTWGFNVFGRLGHGDEDPLPLPKKVEVHFLEGARVGRSRRINADMALAFACVTHPRLGNSSIFGSILGELVQRIIEAGNAWPSRWRGGGGGASG